MERGQHQNDAILKELCSYLLVGGIATVVEWGLFCLLFDLGRIHYLAATALAWTVSTAANWLAGRALTFRGADRQPAVTELAKIYLVSIAGLAWNLALMDVFVKRLSMRGMPAKMLATVIVFTWNFLVRKYWIYRGRQR